MTTDGQHAITALAIDPSTPTTLYAGSKLNVLKSTDAGRSWNAIYGQPPFPPK